MHLSAILKAWQAESCDERLWSEPLHPCNAQERGCMCGIGRKRTFSLRRFCAAWQVGDIRDDHAYPGPYSSGSTETRASVNGEYGGLCMYSEGHSWNTRDQSILSQNDGRGMDNSTMLQVCAASSSFPFSIACPSYCSLYRDSFFCVPRGLCLAGQCCLLVTFSRLVLLIVYGCMPCQANQVVRSCK